MQIRGECVLRVCPVEGIFFFNQSQIFFNQSHVSCCVEQVLSESSWRRSPYVGAPDTLSIPPNEATGLLKRMRAQILFDQPLDQNLKCGLCECTHNGLITHALTQCSHPMRVARRNIVNHLIVEFDPDLMLFMETLEPITRSMALAGLITIQASDYTTAFIHKISPEVFNEWRYADKGSIQTADSLAAAIQPEGLPY